MAPTLRISDKDGFMKGTIEARVGLITDVGVISRVSEKSVWFVSKNGSEWMRRAHDGNLPRVPLYRLPKSDRRALGI